MLFRSAILFFVVQKFIYSFNWKLLGIPDAQILSFDGGAVHECAYEDTESYKVTEMFINNRHILLNKLLSE